MAAMNVSLPQGQDSSVCHPAGTNNPVNNAARVTVFMDQCNNQMEHRTEAVNLIETLVNSIEAVISGNPNWEAIKDDCFTLINDFSTSIPANNIHYEELINKSKKLNSTLTTSGKLACEQYGSENPIFMILHQMGMGFLSKALGKNFYDFNTKLNLPSAQYVGDHVEALFHVVGEQALAMDEIGYRVQNLEEKVSRKCPIMLAHVFEEGEKYCKVYKKKTRNGLHNPPRTDLTNSTQLSNLEVSTV